MSAGLPFRAGKALAGEVWQQVRGAAIFQCCKWDVQSEDHCVLAPYPLLLPREEWQRLSRWAECLAEEALAAEQDLLGKPDLLDRLGLPKSLLSALKRAANATTDHELRVMRFDFHYTTSGWRISEVNADVPGGFIEASGFTGLMAAHYHGTSTPPDPSREYACAIARAAGPGGLVALVHATAYSDDRQVMQYLSPLLRQLGLRTALLSPGHLRWVAGRPQIACAFAEGEPDVVVRFYPAEWLPNLRDQAVWTGYFDGKVPVSNPAAAIVLQSKRFPLTWDSLVAPLRTWRELLPQTTTPQAVPSDCQKCWVLKPALGRVGEDVAVAGVTPPKIQRLIEGQAARRPHRWVAQRRFDVLPLPTAEGGRYACFGVFTLHGRACGVYGRVARKPLIDHEAQDAAVLLEEGRMTS
jgi:glutathionylspermidine synthase